MNFFLKVDFIYPIAILIMTINGALIASFGDTTRFTFIESLKFMALLVIPFYIITILFYSTTFFSLDDKYITLTYFGLIKKSIPYSDIRSIKKIKNVRGILSLSQDKILITSKNNKIPVSLKKNDQFLKILNNKINLQN